MKRALISVSDKSGIVELARELHQLDIELISTGGTYKVIHEAGIPVQSVEDYTGSPEILNGRVKTLHPKIYGGILAIRDDENHMNDLKEYDIKMIDFVVANLYPFNQVIRKEDVTPEEVIENIDIGGVTLIRAAAKNFRAITLLTHPMDYIYIIKEIKTHGEVLTNTRFDLALKGFQMTSYYDATILNYLSEKKSLFRLY